MRSICKYWVYHSASNSNQLVLHSYMLRINRTFELRAAFILSYFSNFPQGRWLWNTEMITAIFTNTVTNVASKMSESLKPKLIKAPISHKAKHLKGQLFNFKKLANLKFGQNRNKNSRPFWDSIFVSDWTKRDFSFFLLICFFVQLNSKYAHFQFQLSYEIRMEKEKKTSNDLEREQLLVKFFVILAYH